MDPPGLTSKVEVERANDDARMMCQRGVQPDKVLTVEREECSDVGGCEKQDRLVWERLPGLADVGDCHHVMPEPAQLPDDRQWEVLVSQETRHCGSSGFVVADLCRDLFPMGADVRPRIRQVLSS
jgi:hypothetical protein